MIENRESPDITDRALPNEAMDSTEPADPMLPMLSTEPTEPIDSSELVEPMLSRESRDRKLQREVDPVTVVSMTECCHHRCEDVSVTVETREDLFGHYDSTIVSVLHPEHGWTDPALVMLERGDTAVVMTAWNPGFERPGRDINELANARMRAELVLTGHETWRADGTSPDGTFHEPGWLAWGMQVPDAIELARRFGQFAIYVFDATGERTTVPCHV